MGSKLTSLEIQNFLTLEKFPVIQGKINLYGMVTLSGRYRKVV